MNLGIGYKICRSLSKSRKHVSGGRLTIDYCRYRECVPMLFMTKHFVTASVKSRNFRDQRPPGSAHLSMNSLLEEPVTPFSKNPLVVVVLGSTASGKSKLAIDLAKYVGGEVISADSMQVYEGLDILTNKATGEEMQGVPHYMIGVVNRSEKFDVVKFRDMALPIVSCGHLNVSLFAKLNWHLKSKLYKGVLCMSRLKIFYREEKYLLLLVVLITILKVSFGRCS